MNERFAGRRGVFRHAKSAVTHFHLDSSVNRRRINRHAAGFLPQTAINSAPSRPVTSPQFQLHQHTSQPAPPIPSLNYSPRGPNRRRKTPTTSPLTTRSSLQIHPHVAAALFDFGL